MIKAVVLVPVRSNSGRPFPRRAWRDLLDQFDQFGGVTIESDVTGRWRGGTRWYTEPMRPYVVALDHWTQLLAWLAIVAWIQTRFAQEAMYIEVAGIPDVWDFHPS